jgi:hypothetical protein
MTTSRWVGSILVVIAASAVACSSSSGGTGTTAKGDGGGGGGGGGSAASCAESLAGQSGTGCSSCVESKCTSQLTAAESACTALFACICPGGTFSESLIAGCQSEAEEGSCSTAGEALSSCTNSNCASVCGSSGGGGTDAGGTSGGSMNVACTVGTEASSLSCTVHFTTAANVAMEKMMECMEINGSVSTECPATENSVALTGCCTSTEEMDEECYYNGDATGDATACTMGGGTWSTKQ